LECGAALSGGEKGYQPVMKSPDRTNNRPAPGQGRRIKPWEKHASDTSQAASGTAPRKGALNEKMTND
jgi:hypothetical protein